MTRRPQSLSSAAVHAPDDAVAEVAGPPFTRTEAAAAIGTGLIALLIAGLMSLLFSALSEAHRLSAPGIGQAAMLEALGTGVVTSLAGIFLKPRRLRLIAAISAAVLVLIDLATLRAGDTAQVLAVRGLAGIPEGVLLWISIGFISRTATPERWAAVLFTGMGVTQLAAATGLSALVLPRFGANGGFVVVAAVAALAVPLALLLPGELGAAASGETSGAPPLRGWVVLFGTLCMAASLLAVSIYVVPLAQQAGLGVGVGRTAITVALACQMAGGVLATIIAGRVGYMAVFAVCGAVFFAMWATFGLHPPAWLFIAMSGAGGLAAFVAGPFLINMTVEADPSRRAAMQSGAVQLLAGALGPFLASLVVKEGDIHGALFLGAGLQAVGLAIAFGLWRAAAADRRGAT